MRPESQPATGLHGNVSSLREADSLGCQMGSHAPMPADVHNLLTLKNIGSAKGLLKSLVPRAQCFCFYGLGRECVWSSDGVEDYEIDSFIAELPEEILLGSMDDADHIKRSLTSGRTLLVLPVQTSEGVALGVLVSVFSKNDGKSSSFNPGMLTEILRPALKVIGESLSLSSQLVANDERAQLAEKELKLLYEIDEKIHGTSRSHAGLAQLIGQSGRFLEIAYSVLLLPNKRIRISATHSTWKNVNRKAVDKYIIEGQHPKCLIDVQYFIYSFRLLV